MVEMGEVLYYSPILIMGVYKVNIKVVIGANYGDEGKGHMVDYFSHVGSKNGLVVLTNGGAQRGHTVVLPDGTRHVFNHFGSGTFSGYDTLCSAYFILNPVVFRKEAEELYSMIGNLPRVYYSRDCRWTTPYDMILNQLLVSKRGFHNSCGIGIWETVKRYRLVESFKSVSIYDFVKMSVSNRLEHINLMNQYYQKMKLEYGIREDADKNIDFGLILSQFCRDCEYFVTMAEESSSSSSVFNSGRYDNSTVIFENGQGLLISGRGKTEKDIFTTPSDCGVSYPMALFYCIKSDLIDDIDVCYVSRSYLTRHGDGEFFGECTKSEIGLGVQRDVTNVPNNWQGVLRYGKLSLDDLISRVYYDLYMCNEIGMNDFESKISLSLALTHFDEYEIDTSGLICVPELSKVYTSFGETSRSVSFKQIV